MEAILGTAIEGGTLYAMARINAGDGGPIDQASLDSAEVEIWKINPPPDEQRGAWEEFAIEMVDGPERFVALAPAVADVVFDTPIENDPRWNPEDYDGLGYNFLLALGPGDFDAIDLAAYPKSQWYRVDVLFTPAAVGATPFIASFIVELKSSLFGKST